MAPAQSAGAPVVPPPDLIARDALLAWFRGEFAAANAIIDALCNHLKLVGEKSEYDSVLASIHQRRMNWIPILQMQKHFTIADVAFEIHQVSAKKMEGERPSRVSLKQEELNGSEERVEACSSDSDRKSVEDREVQGFQDRQCFSQDVHICSVQEDCRQRPARIMTTKGFIAKEPVKDSMVNVVKGLKLYENVCTSLELSKLILFTDEIRLAGRTGELSGETFLSLNNQLKGSRREIIQLGIPICGFQKDAAAKYQKSNIEPIPGVLKAVIDHLIQWELIPENRRPNCCVINFFDEGDYSQPYLKPPYLEQPVSTLFLSESTMAFGRVLAIDHHGSYKGSLMLSLKEGSLIVMRGNSCDMARHVICPSPNKRVTITFFKVCPSVTNLNPPVISMPTGTMTLWQSAGPQVGPQYQFPIGDPLNRAIINVVPRWGVLHVPLPSVGPGWPGGAAGQWRKPRGGTGVFLPWRENSSRSTNHHRPPRQRGGRHLSLPCSREAKTTEATPKSDVSV